MRGFSLIVTAEHASNAIPPPELGDLGLAQEILDSHVAWDPGAKEVATQLAAALSCPLHLGGHTRLVADLNRSPGTKEVVPEIAFGVPVPKNAGLSPAERRAREDLYHRPYWLSVQGEIERARPPVLHLSIHSFTAQLGAEKRALDLGVLFDPDREPDAKIARHLVRALGETGFDTRENRPYDGRSDGLTTHMRGRLDPTAYSGIEIEISQRLLHRLDAIARALTLAVSSVRP
jgi:predicted N-formylglutamate amidohydrolase